MEKSLEDIISNFDIDLGDTTQLSPLVLAYIGDAVYEMVVRILVLDGGNRPVQKLHRDSKRLVNAKTQAAIIKLLQPSLSAEELSVYRRGRNAHSHTMAKNASMGEYRQATGFEALIGYLYLNGDFSRVLELIRLGIRRFDRVGDGSDE